MSLFSFFKNYIYWRLIIPASCTSDIFCILNGPLPRALKLKSIYTSSALAIRRFLPRPNAPVVCSILGYRTRAFSLNTLHFLNQEIFVKLEYFIPIKSNNPYILDCGSNIGISILFFKALYPNCSIVGFEPSASTYSILRENISYNKLTDISVHQYAVGDRDGQVTFFQDLSPGSPVASTNPMRISTNATIVEQVRLSRFVDRDVDLLKLDVEGAEDKVLSELVISKAIYKIKNMIIEYHHHIDKDTDSLSQFIAVLETHGFGYLIAANLKAIKRPGEFQDLLIYAYKK